MIRHIQWQHGDLKRAHVLLIFRKEHMLIMQPLKIWPNHLVNAHYLLHVSYPAHGLHQLSNIWHRKTLETRVGMQHKQTESD